MSNKRVLQIAKKELTKAKAPSKPKDIIYDPMGQWRFPGQETRVPSGDITMQGVPYPVYAQPNVGQPQMMYPGQEYSFPGADYVDEYPQMRKGGDFQKYQSLPANYGKKKYSSNISATNRLFAKNFLFRKEKNKIYNPNAKFAEGGSSKIECDPGFWFDESVGTCVPIKKRILIEDENDPRYQDYLTKKKLYEHSQMQNFPSKRHALTFYANNSRTPLSEKESIISEQLNDWKEKKEYTDDTYGPYGSKTNKQNLSPEEFNKWVEENNVKISSKDKTNDFYKKYPPKGYEVYETESDFPNQLMFTKKDERIITKPQTAYLEDKFNRAKLKEVYPDLTDSQIDKWVTDVRTKPEYITNTFNDHGYRNWIYGPGENVKTVTDDGETIEWVPKEYPDFNPPTSIKDSESGVMGYYPDYIQEDFSKQRSYTPIWGEPEEAYDLKLPGLEPKKPGLISIPKGTIQGSVSENLPPEYQVPDYKKTGPVLSVEEGKTRSYKGLGIKTNGRRINRTKYYNLPKFELYQNVEKDKLIPKVIQNITGYDPNYMEGYIDEEGNEIPGEIQKAKEEDRRIEFKGISSRKDKKAQEEYNKAYDAYEDKKRYYENLLSKNRFDDGGFIEAELDDDEIQAYKEGGYIVEDISIPSLNQYQDGGENNFYKVKGSKGVYRKVDGKWEVDWDKTGNFQQLSKGDVKKRSEQLNKNAELLFDPTYSDLISSQKAEYKPAPKTEPKKKVTPGQSTAQKVFAKDFKVSGKDRLGKAEDKIEKGVADYIKYHNENFDRTLTQQDIDNARETISNNVMASEGVYDPSAGEFNTNRETISNADAKNFVAFNEKPKNLTAGDYFEKGWDVLSNPLDYANYFLKPKGTVNTPWNMHEYEKRLEKVGAEDPVTNNAVSEGLDFASWFLPAGMVAQGIKMIPDTAESIGTAIEDPTLSNIGKAVFDTGMTAISVMPGFKYAKEGAKYLTEATPLRNAYKYNPWAFKPNSESAYRMIGGKEGYLDALESGVLRPKQNGRYDATFYNVGKPLDRYKAGFDPQYMAEVPLSNKNIYPRFAGDDYRISEEIGAEILGERIPQGHVDIKDPGVKIYKENWLRGYKPVDVPKQLSGFSDTKNLQGANVLKQIKAVPVESGIKRAISNITTTAKEAGKDIIYQIDNYSNIKNTPKIYKEEVAKLLTDKGKERLKGLGVEDIDDFMNYINRGKSYTTRGTGTHAGEMVDYKNVSYPSMNIDFEELNKLKGSEKLTDKEIKFIVSHELGHNIQSYLESIGRTYKGRSYLDIEAVHELAPFIKEKPKEYLEKSAMMNDAEAENLAKKLGDHDGEILNASYFIRGSKGNEPLPHLRELKQRMLNKGVINNIHDEITAKDIGNFYINHKGYKDRILSFIKPGDDSYKTLAKLLNKTPVVIPAAIGVGALQQEKDGGVVSELSQKEIDDLIAQGYIVEDID